MSHDPRRATPTWAPWDAAVSQRLLLPLAVLASALAVWYFGWLLQPERVGHPVLYGVLVAAELFNLVQAGGFWWTLRHMRRRRPPEPPTARPAVDVLVPVYDEPLDVVTPTVEAATALAGARVRVHLCDDGGRDELAALADRLGTGYLRRDGSEGAKAGNLNHALARTDAAYLAVFDCDHVPDARFLEATLGHFRDPAVAFVQTPQYYANHDRDDVPGAAWEQQALFFGPIALGKDGLGAMFCCGTNVVFRRRALDAVGGFPQESVTEDFELSVRLHEQGWRTVYEPQVLARGLGPEDVAGYVGQQDRWARGCVAGARSALRARLPAQLRLQYLLASMFFFTGWTYLVYMALPAIQLATGAQPVAMATADRFVVHFVPYFALALLTVSVASASRYTFRAFALMVASFWIHVQAGIAILFGRRKGFTVTPKTGASGWQPAAVAPALAAIVVLAGLSAAALTDSTAPSVLNNVAFAGLHVAVLLRGVWPAVRGAGPALRQAVAARRAAPAGAQPEQAPERLA